MLGPSFLINLSPSDKTRKDWPRTTVSITCMKVILTHTYDLSGSSCPWEQYSMLLPEDPYFQKATFINPVRKGVTHHCGHSGPHQARLSTSTTHQPRSSGHHRLVFEKHPRRHRTNTPLQLPRASETPQKTQRVSTGETPLNYRRLLYRKNACPLTLSQLLLRNRK